MLNLIVVLLMGIVLGIQTAKLCKWFDDKIVEMPNSTFELMEPAKAWMSPVKVTLWSREGGYLRKRVYKFEGNYEELTE